MNPGCLMENDLNLWILCRHNRIPAHNILLAPSGIGRCPGGRKIEAERIWWCEVIGEGFRAGPYDDPVEDWIECPAIDLPENTLLHKDCGRRWLVRGDT